jgi:hypothetical protein
VDGPSVHAVPFGRLPAPTPDRAPEISERAAIGQALAKELRLTYVSDPAAFRGRLLDCTLSPSGREYARIVDHARGHFILIPNPRMPCAVTFGTFAAAQMRATHFLTQSRQ